MTEAERYAKLRSLYLLWYERHGKEWLARFWARHAVSFAVSAGMVKQ